MINRRIAGGVEDSGRMRGPWRRGQEDKDEEDERTRMRRTWMILQDSIIIKLHDVDRVGKRLKAGKMKQLKEKEKILDFEIKLKRKGKGNNCNEFCFYFCIRCWRSWGEKRMRMTRGRDEEKDKSRRHFMLRQIVCFDLMILYITLFFLNCS